MIDKIQALLPLTARRWLYGVLGAAGAIASARGIMTTGEVALWLALAASILIPGVALANPTPRRAKHAAAEGDDVDEDGAALPT